MALVLKKKVTRSEDGETLFIEVVEATGTYDVDDNPGGFGAPNPARNTLALLFYGNFKRVAGDVEAEPLTFDATTVATFNIPITRTTNGHINFSIFAVPVYIVMGVYVDGDIVYDNQNPSAPLIKKRVGGVWVNLTEEDLLIETSVVQTEGNAFPIPDAEEYQNELSAQRLKYLQAYVNNEFQEDKYTPARNDFDYVNETLNNAVRKFCAGAYGTAQQLLEAVQAFEDYKKAA